ncbi:MAG: serine--tRNA ligase [Patescibacteria group bacterium]
MLSIDYIKENKNKVLETFKNKGYPIVNLDKLLLLNDNLKKLSTEVQLLRQDLNANSKKGIDEATKEANKKIREQIQDKENEIKKYESNLNSILLEIPNIPNDDVPIGTDETQNKVLRTQGVPTKFDFKPKDHLELGESLDIIDVKTASKVSGSRFGYLKNESVILEFALIQFALSKLIKKGFIPIIPPVLINKEITQQLGYWQGGGHEDYYSVLENKTNNQGYYLVGTAEHSMVPMHKDELLSNKLLPLRYVGFSTAFRREAGSYGKDVRGIFRVHQFDKVEMVSYTSSDNDTKEHEFLLSIEEELFQELGIPYQVLQICTGDLGFPIAKKFDINAWIPSQNKYRELTSVSTTTDFQARRLNIKYQDKTEKKYAHILNGTAFAIGRTIIAILENFQQKDGSVKIPKILHKYTGFTEIKKP